MYKLCFIYILSLTFGLIPAFAQDPDTVWTLKKEGIDYVKFSPDGKKIYASCYKSITEIESSTGKILRNFDSVNFPLGPWYMEITKDGKYVLTAGYSYNIFAWNTETGESLGEVNYQRVIYGKHNFTIHPTDHKLYFGSNDTIILYDIDSNIVISRTVIPGATIVKIKASKDNKYLAVCSEYYNNSKMIYQKKIIIIDTEKFNIISEIINNVQDLLSLDFSADSKYITYVYSEDRGQFCGIYNIESSENKLFANNRLLVTPLASKFFGFNNLILISGFDKTNNYYTSVFDYNKKSILYTVNYGGGIDNIDINDKNEIIISSFGASRTLALINSNWFSTGVPANDSIFHSGNLTLSNKTDKIILNNIDNEIIKFINIFDINGKLIKSYDAGYTGALVELAFVAPAGLYLARIVTGDNDYSFKFIISN